MVFLQEGVRTMNLPFFFFLLLLFVVSNESCMSAEETVGPGFLEVAD
jgi:hypothetical protein